MDSNPHFVKAQIGDLSEILKIFHLAITVTAKEFYTTEQINAWANTVYSNRNMWEHRIKNEEFIVAKFNDKIIGFAALKGLLYFDLLFVSPSFGRMGIGSELYDILEAKIPKGTILETHASKISKPFFIKKGFNVSGENKVELLGVKFINHLMTKQL